MKSQPVSASLSQPQPVSASLSQSQPVSASLSQSQPVSASLSQPQPASASLSQSQPVSASLSQSQPPRFVLGTFPGRRFTEKGEDFAVLSLSFERTEKCCEAVSVDLIGPFHSLMDCGRLLVEAVGVRPLSVAPARLHRRDKTLESLSGFQVSMNDDGLIVATLERSDLQENATAYAAQVSGEPRLVLVQFVNTSEPLVFNATFHGLCYTVGLLVKLGQSWSRPVKSIPVLTKPLPVRSAHISDYKDAPETGVVFDIDPPSRTVFSRVNISYTEGQERRSMLYKDFYKGKTVFKHWLPGMCYRNITFQLISEATVYQTALVSHSDITHVPLHHRTGGNCPSPSYFYIHICGGCFHDNT
ncbi:receptor-type tyrosine-protein phosphatase O-like [Xenentodon cancila]